MEVGKCGERYIENHVTYHQASGDGSITVWGGISWIRTQMVILENATMNSVRYLIWYYNL